MEIVAGCGAGKLSGGFSEGERRAVMALISELELRYNIAVGARREFLRP